MRAASNARASSPLCAAYFSEDAGFHRVAGRSDRCCRGRRFLKCSAVVAPPCYLGSRYVLQNVVMRTIGMNEFLNWCGLSKDVPQSRSRLAATWGRPSLEASLKCSNSSALATAFAFLTVRLTVFRAAGIMGRPLAAAFPARAPTTQPTTAATGPITLPGNPASANQAATKHYQVVGFANRGLNQVIA